MQRVPNGRLRFVASITALADHSGGMRAVPRRHNIDPTTSCGEAKRWLVGVPRWKNRDGNWNQSLASCHDHYPTRLERTAMQVTQPLGPPNLCRNGACGELVEICCRFQHYCCGCASGNLGLRAGEPALRITLALRRRRRVVGRVLLCHKARPPTCVVTYIIDHLMNDLGKVSLSTRWACILIRSGVLE